MVLLPLVLSFAIGEQERQNGYLHIHFLFLVSYLILVTLLSSDRKDVFNFQNPGPLGFEFEAIAMVIIEWSVLNLGTISKVLILLIKLWLVRKKSSLH